jgi:transposase
MAGAYSQDLRDRVIDAVETEGMSRRAAARRFGVSASAAVKWLQRYEDRAIASRSAPAVTARPSSSRTATSLRRHCRTNRTSCWKRSASACWQSAA